MNTAPSNADEGDQKNLGPAPDDVPVKEEELDPEARALLGKKRNEYTQMFLSIYERTKNGGLRQKLPCPRTIMLDSNRRPRDEDMFINHVPGGNLRRMIHEVVHHATCYTTEEVKKAAEQLMPLPIETTPISESPTSLPIILGGAGSSTRPILPTSVDQQQKPHQEQHNVSYYQQPPIGQYLYKGC